MSKLIRTACAILFTLALWHSTSSVAQAQSNYSRINKPFNRPTFSPYLNLFRSGNGPVLNYFGVVRPQQQFLEQDNQLGSQLTRVQGQQERQQTKQNSRRVPGVYTMGATGHAVGFNTIRSGGQGQQQQAGSQISGFGNQGESSPFGGTVSGNSSSLGGTGGGPPGGF